MGHRLTDKAETDLDDIWLYVAKESGDVTIAQNVVFSITERFHLLATHPYAGRARDSDLGPGRRSFPVGNYVIVYSIVNSDVLILRVAHGSRNLAALMKR